jgi:enamine deaminase RidA (YjgF/YER057c/UK114 family)
MTITRIDPGQRFCKAVVHNGTAYLAGLTASDLSAGTTGQTEQILAAINHYLAEAGTSKSKLLTANIWLRDIADFALMNAAWDAWIDRANMPVRATVEARLAGDAYRVEIQVTAAL